MVQAHSYPLALRLECESACSAGDGEAARPLWGLLLSGPDDLARERAAGPHGKLREAAVLAALKLLRAAFERDEAAALALSAGSGPSCIHKAITITRRSMYVQNRCKTGISCQVMISSRLQSRASM